MPLVWGSPQQGVEHTVEVLEERQTSKDREPYCPGACDRESGPPSSGKKWGNHTHWPTPLRGTLGGPAV